MIIALVGARFRSLEEQAALLEAEVGDEVTLEAEPDNKFDPNAIKVMLGQHHVGYIPRDRTEDITLGRPTFIHQTNGLYPTLIHD